MAHDYFNDFITHEQSRKTCPLCAVVKSFFYYCDRPSPSDPDSKWKLSFNRKTASFIPACVTVAAFALEAGGNMETSKNRAFLKGPVPRLDVSIICSASLHHTAGAGHHNSLLQQQHSV